MCNPVLLLAGAGAVVQGISAYQGYQTQAANYRAEAAAATRDAEYQREVGSYEGARAAERGRQVIGRQVAGYAASGISPSTGTAADTIARTGADIGLDIAASRYGTKAAIENSQYKARVATYNAGQAAAAAPIAFASPILSAGATYLRGAYG